MKKGNQILGWSGIEVERYRRQFQQEMKSEDLMNIYPHLDIFAKNLLVFLENICGKRYENFEEEVHTYVVAKSNYERLVREGMRHLSETGFYSTTKKILNRYFYK
jgi:hypothetical protein